MLFRSRCLEKRERKRAVPSGVAWPVVIDVIVPAKEAQSSCLGDPQRLKLTIQPAGGLDNPMGANRIGLIFVFMQAVSKHDRVEAIARRDSIDYLRCRPAALANPTGIWYKVYCQGLGPLAAPYEKAD